jgi:hypothetical protein
MRQRTLAPTLIGRQEHLAELGELLALARAGQGQVVFLAGEAGIGKTRLVEEFVRSAPADVTVLTGHCFDEQPAPPYGPFAELLHRAGQTLGPAAAPVPPDLSAGDLRGLLPDGAPAAPPRRPAAPRPPPRARRPAPRPPPAAPPRHTLQICHLT